MPIFAVFPVTRQKVGQLFRKVKRLSMSALWFHDTGLGKATAILAVWGLALGDGRRALGTSAVDVLLYDSYFWFVL